MTATAATAATANGPRAPSWAQLLPLVLLMAVILATTQAGSSLAWSNVRGWPWVRNLLQNLFLQFSLYSLLILMMSRALVRWCFVGSPIRRLAWGVLAWAACSGVATGISYLHALSSGAEQIRWFDVVNILAWFGSLHVMLMLGLWFWLGSRWRMQALHDAQVAHLAGQQQAQEAQEQLMRAQVEPHFIFNALANVRHLMKKDAAAAQALLGDLVRYLDGALPKLRGEVATLGQEAGLVQAFLAIHQVRMGNRLSAKVDVGADMHALPMPPMLLLTLVENALKHGLAPLVEGGQVVLRGNWAAGPGGAWWVEVADTGAGMGAGSGSGTGLANVQARLKQIHPQARLSLSVNAPRGVVARLEVPAASLGAAA